VTLLSIAQDILKETKSSSVPSTIIGNNEDSAKQVLQAITIAITNLSRSFDWQELQKEHTFSSVASTATYALPSDFDRFIDNTFWNTTQQRNVIGAMTPEEWRILNNATITGATVNDYFRIRQDLIVLYPTPSAVESFIFEYISNEIVEDSGGTGQTGWQADTDVPVIDDYILRLDATWRLLAMQGRPYAEKQRELDLALAERVSINGANKTITHVRRSTFDKSRIGYPTLVTTS